MIQFELYLAQEQIRLFFETGGQQKYVTGPLPKNLNYARLQYNKGIAQAIYAQYN